jgi:hypothetical protein
MFVVGVCYFLLQYVTPGTNKRKSLDLWKLLLFPYNVILVFIFTICCFLFVMALVDVLKMNTVKN